MRAVVIQLLERGSTIGARVIEYECRFLPQGNIDACGSGEAREITAARALRGVAVVFQASAQLDTEALEAQLLDAEDGDCLLIDGRRERLRSYAAEIAAHSPCAEASREDADLLLLGNAIERVLPVVEARTNVFAFQLGVPPIGQIYRAAQALHPSVQIAKAAVQPCIVTPPVDLHIAGDELGTIGLG